MDKQLSGGLLLLHRVSAIFTAGKRKRDESSCPDILSLLSIFIVIG